MSRLASSLASCAVALAGLGLAACSIPNTAFQATPDGSGGGGDDAMSTVLAIRPSVASLDVDEGKTADFTIQLTQAPSAELVVKVMAADDASQAAIGLSLPELRFGPTTFDLPQVITVTGVMDINASDAVATISLTADGVDPVTVTATVRDPDKVDIATDIGSSGVKTLLEAKSGTVKVHLTHEPAGDVRVKATLGSGPVTVSPAEVTFTTANYSVDQTFTFSAADDANVMNEDVSLSFQATGVMDKLATIHVVDDDTLNISATPTTLPVDEGGNSLISVSLTQQPGADTTVHVALQNGSVSVDKTDLVFTMQNFNQVQTIKVSAPQDSNAANEQNTITLSIPSQPTVQSVTIGVNTVDDDTQAIVIDAPDPLSVTENQTTSFGVKLKFQPTDDVTVTVASLDSKIATATPGTLTFNAQNYNDAAAHQVTVKGSDDNNLATNGTKIKLQGPSLVDVLAPVNVADDDTQAIVLSKTSLTVPEGMTGTFNVSLKFDPGTTVIVDLADDNISALPINKSQITFTGGATGNWATPVTVTVSPPVDPNANAETATVTVSGGGAPTPATVALSVSDSTVVQDWGFATPFNGMFQVPLKFVYAYPISVGAVGNLSTFHTYLAGAAGTYSMALYTDAGGVPGTLVTDAAMSVPKVAATGVNTSDPLATPPQLTAPIYWLAIRFSQTNVIGYATSPPVGGQKGKQCLRNQSLDLSLPWPPTFGSAMCQDDFLFNLWITTFHQ